MIELLAITQAVADLIDEAHAESNPPLFEAVTRTLRPHTPVDRLDRCAVRVSVSPRRSVLVQTSRSTVDVEPLVVQVLLERRLGELQDEAADFAAAIEFAKVVKAVEETLWQTDEVENEELEVTASLSSVEEGPDDDENLSALSLDEDRVLRAVLMVNYTARRSI